MTTTSSLPRLGAGTAGGRPPAGTGIVHLGLGNFHRAHQAVHTAAALAHTEGPWGILGVANRSAGVADALREQDLRYAVVEIAPDHTEVTVPAVHTGALVAAAQPEEVLTALAAPATAVVTLTVTEHGYTFSPRTHGLDTDSPAVRADLRGDAPPRTTIGRIVRGLQRRQRTHGAPVTVLSCDNLVANGAQTERLVREFAQALPAAERDALTPWLDEAVTFPSSMVDRIVPATTDVYRAAVAERLGVRDAVPVPAEPFSMWVMEDRFAAGRPRWEQGGALFTADVEPYELLKLRLLNGTHSLIAYLGALDGRATIPESVARPFVERAARGVLAEEYLPSLTVPAGIDVAAYIRQLFERWANTALGHRTQQVGSDGSVKLRQRVPEPALLHLRAGRMPHRLALTVAAYLCCVAPPAGFSPGPHAAAMVDPARGTLAALAGRAATAPGGSGAARTAFVEAVLDSGLLGDGLTEHPAFGARIAELIDVIVRFGPGAAAEEAETAADEAAAPPEAENRQARERR
ncbi:mannitol dehydrogenase family protein [Streptomyces sp. NPDC093085]|uniref:mannitol dehydrogenase family protein n=1 Tax=Streptomyces sp. NPDC093085 TaxID=3155068 RepID=UPI003434BDC6